MTKGGVLERGGRVVGGGVSVVVPQRGRVELTRGCVAGVRRWEGEAVEIVVVDDGSPEECREATRELERSGSRVVWRVATGVTASWNAGWRAARGEVVVFLNNDVEVSGAFLERLVEPLRGRGGERRGGRNPRLTGVRWREERGLGRVLEGWCFAVRKETLEELGGFDERMRVYFSDTDLQRRVMARWGREAVNVPPGDWPVVHLGHRTAGDPAWREMRRRVWREDRRVYGEGMTNVE